VLRNELCHLEHGHLRFAEDRFQVRVRVDVSAVLLVLQIVLLDIFPKLLDDLCARDQLRSDDFRQSVARL